MDMRHNTLSLAYRPLDMRHTNLPPPSHMPPDMRHTAPPTDTPLDMRHTICVWGGEGMFKGFNLLHKSNVNSQYLEIHLEH